MGKDALIEQRAGLGGVDLVRAVESTEAVADSHPGQIAIQLPRGLARGGGQRVADRVQLPDGADRPRHGRAHAAGDVVIALPNQAQPCGAIGWREDTDRGAHPAQPVLLVAGPVGGPTGGRVRAEVRLVLPEETSRDLSVRRGPCLGDPLSRGTKYCAARRCHCSPRRVFSFITPTPPSSRKSARHSTAADYRAGAAPTRGRGGAFRVSSTSSEIWATAGAPRSAAGARPAAQGASLRSRA